MTAKLWQFSALDTFFFRDGTPFHAGEGGQAAVTGGFPPFMSTLQGAIRTTLAYQQGWSPKKQQNWPQELGSPDDLGQLKLRGPYLLVDNQFMLPAPLFLLRHETRGKYTRLVPGPKVSCDLGSRQLPVQHPPLPGAKSMENKWLTTSDIETVLNQGLPQPNQEPGTYWHQENRIGLERQVDTRTAQATKLYSCRHIRPHNKVQLVVEVYGVPESWHQNLPQAVPLGGEGRWACLKIKDRKTTLPSPPGLKPVDGKVKYLVTLITPGHYEHSQIKKIIEEGPPELPGRCVSACIGKMLQMGGWDLSKQEPRPLKPFIPAGSTWFLETEETQLEAIYDLHGQCLGDKTSYGYGQILIGCWGDK